MKNKILGQIPGRILTLATGALTQANTHAVFFDPGKEHWDFISITNTAHAGELFLKAIIAKEHPLLIFRDLFNLDDNRTNTLDLVNLIKKGRTHDFERLPQVLWVATGRRWPPRGLRPGQLLFTERNTSPARMQHPIISGWGSNRVY
jgi:hypothetical protein